ncbi:hypothetical protein SY2F82_29200 [Streptomyces sp. Y2F8-2]|nr:hypothetical protein SY2F82_29200 [Streptomyces sp. Y2F8-2]
MRDATVGDCVGRRLRNDLTRCHQGESPAAELLGREKAGEAGTAPGGREECAEVPDRAAESGRGWRFPDSHHSELPHLLTANSDEDVAYGDCPEIVRWCPGCRDGA